MNDPLNDDLLADPNLDEEEKLDTPSVEELAEAEAKEDTTEAEE